MTAQKPIVFRYRGRIEENSGEITGFTRALYLTDVLEQMERNHSIHPADWWEVWVWEDVEGTMRMMKTGSSKARLRVGDAKYVPVMPVPDPPVPIVDPNPLIRNGWKNLYQIKKA